MKARRKVWGISQEKLAELIDVSTQTINDIECCRSWVSDRTISKLAEALGVEVFQLFVPRDDLTAEDPATLATALMRLRQDMKSDLGAYIESYITERFSRFLNAELPTSRDNGT
jgi:transcriptional regulator with XRE-family HTH domain